VKKLGVEGDITIFEVRAYFSGSNNVRLLFSRSADGRAQYGFGGIKGAPDCYDYVFHKQRVTSRTCCVRPVIIRPWYVPNDPQNHAITRNVSDRLLPNEPSALG
jgi:hypothetical protein